MEKFWKIENEIFLSRTPLNWKMSCMANKTINKKFRHVILEGDPKDVGKIQGELVKKSQNIVRFFASKRKLISIKDLKEINEIYEEFCPELLQEIEGFSEALGVPIENLRYYDYTWLKPRCSQFSILPSKSTEQKIFAARNYDFSHRLDDMMLCKTSIKNNYAHLGFSTLLFGRVDGVNEKGLAITMSSTGFPVGNFPKMRPPKFKGLQFWAVIRAILDKCKNVDDAIKLVEKIPMAYNANFIVSDESCSIALIETFDGAFRYKKIDSSSKENYLSATNHIVLPELIHYDPKKMYNSRIRFDLIKSKMEKNSLISKNDIKKILSDAYPDGLCCHFYTEFFGTLSSAIYDPIKRKVDICFGPGDLNPWYSISLDDSLPREYDVVFPKERTPAGFWDME